MLAAGCGPDTTYCAAEVVCALNSTGRIEYAVGQKKVERRHTHLARRRKIRPQ